MSDLEILVERVIGCQVPVPPKDGPAPPGDCQNCGQKKDGDIYWHGGRKLCGDCRFKARTGKWPAYTNGCGIGGGPLDEISPWQENAIRAMEDG